MNPCSVIGVIKRSMGEDLLTRSRRIQKQLHHQNSHTNMDDNFFKTATLSSQQDLQAAPRSEHLSSGVWLLSRDPQQQFTPCTLLLEELKNFLSLCCPREVTFCLWFVCLFWLQPEAPEPPSIPEQVFHFAR